MSLILYGKGYALQEMFLGKLNNHMIRMKFDPNLTPIIKINLSVNIRPKTVKLLDENIWEKLFDIGLGKHFLDMILKAQITRWSFSQWKRFCISKETIKKNEKASNEIGQDISNPYSGKGLMFKLYKTLIT